MYVWLRTLIATVVVFAAAFYLATWLLSTDEPIATTTKPGQPVLNVEREPARIEASNEEPEPQPAPDLPRFEKLDSAGRVLPATAESWDCVRDNENGLVWEVKETNGGLRDLDFTYSWYSPDGELGIPDGGECYYIYCDTYSLVEAVNEEGLCGWRDWRLPTNLELMSLDTERLYYDPDIDQRYFPNTQSGYYWTSTLAGVGPLSWSVNFLNGFPEVSPRRLAYYVRLVRDD